MLQVAKKLILVGALISLSACASVFSAYDSEFSCKNDDHGGCTHPLEAYEQARSEVEPSFDQVGDHDTYDAHHHEADATVADNTPYETYQDAVYGELTSLLKEPETPVLRPAKTIRTLILPAIEPDKEQQLFMPRYVFTVLENPKFVLGNYLVSKDAGLSLETLIGSNDADKEED